jgi:hypothetical protein
MHKKTDKQIQNANETNTETIPNEIPESENNVFNEQTIVSPIPAAEVEIESSEPSANMAEEKNYGTVPLVNERGKEVEFEILDILHYEGKVYDILYCEEEDPNTVTILEVIVHEEDEDREEYLPVESDELLNKLFEMFMENEKKRKKSRKK